MTHTAQILVPLDGSDLDATALPLASQVATALEADVTLLRVIEPPIADSLRMRQSRDGLGLLTERLERQTAAELLRYRSYFPGLRVTSVVRVGSEPKQEILDWLQENRVDLVVIATHSHSPLRHHLTESTAEAILHSRLAPVLAVPATPARAAA